jgi:predicted Zn-dependent protease
VPQPRALRFAVIIATALVAFAALALLADVVASDRLARDTTRPAADRLAAAARARSLLPLSPHVQTTYAIAQADALVAQGQVDDAYRLLLPLASTVRDDPQFRATYQRVLAIKWPLDARKAHQQHAREKKGGALDESDVLK